MQSIQQIKSQNETKPLPVLTKLKRHVVSRPGRMVCSECRKGWNGTGRCVFGGELATRILAGCGRGELLKELRTLYRIQPRKDKPTPERIDHELKAMGL